jgi:hypothetical protein
MILISMTLTSYIKPMGGTQFNDMNILMLIKNIVIGRQPLSPEEYKKVLSNQLDNGYIDSEFEQMYGYDTAHNLGIYMKLTHQRVKLGIPIYSEEYKQKLKQYGNAVLSPKK